MPLISRSFIDDLNQTPLDDIASKLGITPKKTKGNSYTIPCISYDHEDKHPSMSIDTGKNEFFCHSCNCSGGGAINFLAAYSGIDPKTDFVRAIESASSILGQEIIYEKESENTVSQKEAIQYVSRALNNQPRPTDPLLAEFISDRGITRNDIAEWGLQYAQKGFGFKFQKNLVPTLAEMGLATVKESTKTPGSTYQFFPLNERLIFPINNERGQLVAFAGRNLSDEAYGPKYKNTENSILFTKMNTLYGLDKVILNHRGAGKEGKIDNIQVLEGYMDVIATHRAGFKTSVAAMGTSFPESQLELLSKHAKGVTFMFDPDGPGIKASQSAMLKACRLADKMVFRFAFSPNIDGVKTDPDYLIKNGLIDEYMSSINNAYPLSTIAARYVLAGSDIKQAEDLIGQPSDRAKEIYLSMPAGIVREAFSQELAKLISNKLGFNVDPGVMGMRLDNEAIHLNKGIETKNSITNTKPTAEKAENPNQGGSKSKSKEPQSIRDFFLPTQPDLDDWVCIPNMEDAMLEIGKVLSSDQGVLTLDIPNNENNRRTVEISEVMKIDVKREIKSKYANAEKNISEGDTIILIGDNWYSKVPNPLDPQTNAQQKPEVNEQEKKNEAVRELIADTNTQYSSPTP